MFSLTWKYMNNRRQYFVYIRMKRRFMVSNSKRRFVCFVISKLPPNHFFPLKHSIVLPQVTNWQDKSETQSAYPAFETHKVRRLTGLHRGGGGRVKGRAERAGGEGVSKWWGEGQINSPERRIIVLGFRARRSWTRWKIKRMPVSFKVLARHALGKQTCTPTRTHRHVGARCFSAFPWSAINSSGVIKTDFFSVF